MRSGGSVLEAPPQALKRGHSPASIVRVPAVRNGAASVVRKPSQQTAYRHKKALRYVGEPFLYVLELANLNLDGIAGMRSGGSVLEAPGPFTYWGAEEGALPREHCPRACCAELCSEHRLRAGHAERGLRPQGAPAPQRGHSPASGSRLRGNNEAREREPVRRYRSTSPGSRAVPANATGDGA